MNEDNIGIGLNIVSVKMDAGLSGESFDRKILMSELSKVGTSIKKKSQRLLNSKSKSKEGDYPGFLSGRMRRHVKVHKAKRKDKFWVRIQIDTFKDRHFWYPNVLTSGRHDGSLKPRKDAIITANDLLSTKTQQAVSDALDKALRWF